MELKFKVLIKIQNPIEDVFDAVHDPEKLSGYFTNGGASAPLNEGTTVQWAFADNPDEEKLSFPITVNKVIPNELIVFEWAGSTKAQTRVEIKFEKTGPQETLVKISESGWEASQEELDRSYLNCMGWSQMLSALKAFVDYGINLRQGAYTGLYKASDHHSSSQAA